MLNYQFLILLNDSSYASSWLTRLRRLKLRLFFLNRFILFGYRHRNPSLLRQVCSILQWLELLKLFIELFRLSFNYFNWLLVGSLVSLDHQIDCLLSIFKVEIIVLSLLIRSLLAQFCRRYLLQQHKWRIASFSDLLTDCRLLPFVIIFQFWLYAFVLKLFGFCIYSVPWDRTSRLLLTLHVFDVARIKNYILDLVFCELGECLCA